MGGLLAIGSNFICSNVEYNTVCHSLIHLSKMEHQNENTDTSLNLHCQSCFTLTYWLEAFFTASYVANLLPSPTLDNCSPFELLYKEKPDYAFLRVFGSACYPCLRPLNANKFEPRPLQCVFLGYCSNYKGYRFLYPLTGKVYIS